MFNIIKKIDYNFISELNFALDEEIPTNNLKKNEEQESEKKITTITHREFQNEEDIKVY